MHLRRPQHPLTAPASPAPGTPLWLHVEILTCTEALIWSTDQPDEHGKTQHVWLMPITTVGGVLQDVDKIVECCMHDRYDLRTDDAWTMILDCCNAGLKLLGHMEMAE